MVLESGENGLTKGSDERNCECAVGERKRLRGAARRAFTYVKNMTERKIYTNSVGTFLHLLLSH
jgi:hypothetical protein